MAGCLAQVSGALAGIDNTATATGDYNSSSYPSAPVSVSVPVGATTAQVGLVKTAGPVTDANSDGKVDAGDTITYSFAVTNTGTVTLSNVSVTDTKISGITCAATPLAPGATMTCTAPAYVLTQADIDAGQVSNQATVTATPPSGPAVTDLSDPSSPQPGHNGQTVTTLGATAQIALLKTLGTTTDTNGNGVTDAGDVVHYAFTVKNTGSVTLHNITLTDTTATLAGGPLASLAPGVSDTTTFTAAHTLTQAEVDAGQFSNQAQVSGLTPSNATVTDLSDPASTASGSNAPTLLAITAAPKIGLVKTGTYADTNGNGITDVGDKITYGFTVSNLGNVTLTNVGVTDPKVPSITCLATSLAPGASTTCSAAAAYSITQADINAGQVGNQATASGKPPVGVAVTDLSDPTTAGPGNDNQTTVALAASPKVGLVKTGTYVDANSNGVTDMGDRIDYVFTVSNPGNVSLNPVSVTDPLVPTINCPAGAVDPGQTKTCTGSHNLTQSDIDNGVVANSATVSAQPPTGAAVTDKSDPVTAGPSSNNPTLTTLTRTPAIGLVKTAGALSDTNGNGQADAGETMTYNFQVSNMGNVTLYLVGISDPKVGNINCPSTTLLPGTATTCTGDPYVLTQADLDAGTVSNQATAHANTQTGTTVTDLSDPTTPGAGHEGTTSTSLSQKPAIGLVKTALAPTDVNNNGIIDAGDKLNYNFAVTNLGNTSLTGITVTDPKVSGITCVATSLTPGQTTSCSGAAYVLTQADIDAGKVTNQATASGLPPSGPAVTDLSDPVTAGPANNGVTTVTLTAVPQIGLVKAAGTVVDANSSGLLDAGDTINYSFVVTNTGNLTLHGVTVTDTKVSPISCPLTTLLPGQSTTCTGPVYTITQPDIDSGGVSNQATVNALTGSNAPVSDLSDPTTSGPGANTPTVTSLAPQPGIGLVKKAGAIVDANSDSKVDAGDTITYTFIVTNTGNVKLTNVGVTDAMVPGISCPATTLNPGLSTVCTAAPYVLKQADIDAGKVTNQALATGTPPSGPAITDLSDPSSPSAGHDATTVTTIPQQSQIGLVKVSAGVTDTNSNGITDVGDTINYTFTAYNMGTVTLSNLTINDPKLGPVTCSTTTLAPGATTTCAPAAPYAITQTDLNLGRVSNQATATAKTPSGTSVSDTSDPATPGPTANATTDTPLQVTPRIGIVKVSGGVVDKNGNGVTDPGDTITYTFTVTNMGNVALNTISVTDPKIAGISCPSSTLAPSASETCTAPAYTLTQADVDQGNVTNTATAKGTAPDGSVVSDDSDPTTPGLVANSPTVTPVTVTPKMTFVKTAAMAGPIAIGTVINYHFTITNTGNVTLKNITLTDTGATLVGGPIASLAPGAVDSTTFTASHTLTAADIKSGAYTNSATATAHPAPVGSSSLNVTSTATTPLGYTATMTFTKSGVLAAPGPAPKAGDTVNYTLTVTNTGDVALRNVTVTDPKLASTAAMVQRNVALLEGAKKPVDDTFATASLGGTDTTHSGIVAAANRAAAARAAALPQVNSGLVARRTLVRMSGLTGPLNSGEKIGFLYTLTNTGEVPLTAINIAQPDSVAYGSDVSLLNPNVTDGAAIIFTRNLTPEEALAGEVSANAYLTYHVRGREQMAQIQDTLPLSGIKTYDDVATASITPTVWPVLNPGEQHVFTAPYVLTQADIDSGVLNNTAQAQVDDPAGDKLLKTASATVPLTRAPNIGVVKTGTLTMSNGTTVQAGDTITYHFAITNLGNVTLTNVFLQDPTITLVSAPGSTPIASLAPGVTSNVYTAQYTLTQADVDAGKFNNQATVFGTPTGLSQIQALSDFADPKQHRVTSVPLTATPGISLLKQVTNVTTHPNGLVMAGDVISYKFTVVNTGNVTLNSVHVTDPLMPGGTNIVSGGPLNGMAPGVTDATTFTGTYTITQADADRGHVDNTATVTGTPPSGPNVTDQSDPGVLTGNAPTITPLVQGPKVTLVKTLVKIDDVNGDKINDAGDVIHYTFQIGNAGNVTLSNFRLQDLLAGAVVAIGNPALQLAPGQVDSTTFTATYTITKADEKAGVVNNQARVTADSQQTTSAATALSDAANPNSANPQPTMTPIQPTPTVSALLLPPTWVDTNGDGVVNAGDTLNYHVSVKNTGATSLTNLVVTTSTPGLTLSGTINGTLASGIEDSTSITAIHVLTNADLIAGSYNAQVKVTGVTSPGSLIVQDLSDPADYAADAVTPYAIDAKPLIAVLKTKLRFEDATGNEVADPVPGGHVIYKVTLKNTGNVPFTDVELSEVAPYTGTIIGSHPFALDIGATDSTHFTVSQPVTSADIVSGSITNQLQAIGDTSDPKVKSPADLSDPALLNGNSPTIVPLVAKPAMAVVKTFAVEDVNGNGANDTGDIIHYAFAIVNTGNVDLTNVTLTDPTATLVGGPIALLKAGESDISTYTASYVVQAADVTAGHYDNQASATASYSPSKPQINATSDYESLTANPKRPTIVPLSATLPVLTKTAQRSQVKRGEVVPFTIAAANLGSGPFNIADIMPPGFAYVGGSAKVNGVAATPVINGQTLTFVGLAPVSSKITVTLNLLASATLSGGQYVNNARLIHQATGNLIGVASAMVEVMPEAVFDCSDIIGRVFDDLNGDGYMTDGEPGLPGVRIATLNGVLITTDADGKYHVPCAAIPDSAIGSNYMLKLDPRSLPTGYKVTSENPRDVRVTRGKVTILNFGAAKTHDVKLDLTGQAFDPGSVALTQKWTAGLDRVVKILKTRRSTLSLIYHQGSDPADLAQGRLEVVEQQLRDAWAAAGNDYPLTIKTSLAGGQ